MEAIILNDMDRLLPPVEQAKMIGMLKEPERLQQDEKQNYVLYGMAIGCTFIIGCFIVHHFVERKNRQRKKELLS
jgi:hypothetical protein